MKKVKPSDLVVRMRTLVKFKILLFALSLILVIVSCNLEDELGDVHAKEIDRCAFDYYTFSSSCIGGDAPVSAKIAPCLLIADDYQKNCK
ncbi:hypothetical protein LFX25_05435 [Leptospira sp. FAT2]|uniref:hypothetical protein n=1 Tax=Leptospira sanjuanensis TaxID=2879643 RepID=UPI001EE89C55|nr:hypothetical protein [Leptospira sanjuanensis]MCG6192679.1 hypothetical protein [Leptospira sanjuanensis]